jgi:hypothetical protein
LRIDISYRPSAFELRQCYRIQYFTKLIEETARKLYHSAFRDNVGNANAQPGSSQRDRSVASTAHSAGGRSTAGRERMQGQRLIISCEMVRTCYHLVDTTLKPFLPGQMSFSYRYLRISANLHYQSSSRDTRWLLKPNSEITLHPNAVVMKLSPKEGDRLSLLHRNPKGRVDQAALQLRRPYGASLSTANNSSTVDPRLLDTLQRVVSA